MAETTTILSAIIPKKDELESEKKLTHPLVRFTDMPEDTKPEIIDLITGALEKYVTSLEAACKAIKEEMDKVYGEGWLIVAGENFGFDVTYQKNHILYMFSAGNLGILVWKCG